MWSRVGYLRASLACLVTIGFAACRAEVAQPAFPAAGRDVAPTVSDRFSTEDARDRLGEAEQVMALAGVREGMSVADVGAGEGYYTVRLARADDPASVLLPPGAQPFDSGDIPAGQVYRHTFTVPGEYRYFCIPHEDMGMVGTVIVQGG